MKFGPLPVEAAVGKILGHNIAGPDGRRALRKGRALSAADIELLQEIGRRYVYIADLDEGDVDENEAAHRVGLSFAGVGLEVTRPSVGRVNFLTETMGVLRVDLDKLFRFNSYEGVTLATRQADRPVAAGKIAATLKIIPYALPAAIVEELGMLSSDLARVLWIEELIQKRVGFIFSSTQDAQDRVQNNFEGPLRERVEGLGSIVSGVEYVPLEDESGESSLSEMLQEMVRKDTDLIVLAGETAIMDRNDIAPRAVERAGGQVETVGVPVDPGNLLMLAYLEDVPILGAPGCARSRKTNVIDWVLPRLLVRERLSRDQLIRMANGGLLEDTPLRPKPRS